MAKEFSIEIISPEKNIYSGKIISLVAPAQLGYLGVLADHAPLAANTVSGKIILREASGRVVNIETKATGFLEVLNNHVTLLLSSI